MVTVYDVPAERLIEKTAVKLREIDTIKPPEWAEFVRTGRHTEKAPAQKDWWYTRAASILRKVYIMGPIGTSRLAEEYGGFADRGSRPNKAVKGSRNIARKCIMQLEASGLVAKNKNQGRMITAKGQKLLDAAAKEIAEAPKK
ncbi:MAG TPA: 30S ribosomal protein S19e [Methanomassiliicoccales archaeon]|nr:30S ribosomal protein S19e [Methanomassiliicoccales archaeon]